MSRGIIIFGSPGSGTTTLGREVSLRLGFKHFDLDDYLWLKDSDLPFTATRPRKELTKLLMEDISKFPNFVMSGSMDSYNEPFVPLFDWAVLNSVPVELRIERINKREFSRFGSRILPGGDMYENHMKFLDLVRRYDFYGGISMIEVNYATSDDFQVLGNIHASSWKVAYRNIIPEEVLNNITAEKRGAYFRKALTEGWEQDAIIYEDGTPLVLICIGKARDIDLDNSHGEIWGIYLLPEVWGKGIGSILIQWGIAELKNRGYEKISLWVLKDNVQAIKFYEKSGFTFDGTSKEINIGMPLIECRYIK